MNLVSWFVIICIIGVLCFALYIVIDNLYAKIDTEIIWRMTSDIDNKKLIKQNTDIMYNLTINYTNCLDKLKADLLAIQNKVDNPVIGEFILNSNMYYYDYNKQIARPTILWVKLYKSDILESCNDEIKLGQYGWVPKKQVIFYDDIFADLKAKTEAIFKDDFNKKIKRGV